MQVNVILQAIALLDMLFHLRQAIKDQTFEVFRI